MANFDESKHPRDDDGKFTDGNGSRWTTSKRDYSNVQGEEKKRLQSDSGSGKISLSKQEWAQYYKIIGDEQHGDFVYHIGKIGRAVRLGNKMIFDNGSFENPKVTKIVEFPSNDAMNDVFSYFAERGDIE